VIKFNYVFSSFNALVRITLAITNSLSSFCNMGDGGARKTASRPTTYEVCRPQYTPPVHCRARRSLLLYSKVSQRNPVSAGSSKNIALIWPRVFKTYFNIIFPYRRNLKCLNSRPYTKLYDQSVVSISHCPLMSPFQFHSLLLDLLNNLCAEKYKSCSVTLCKFIHPPLTSSLFFVSTFYSMVHSQTRLMGHLNALWQ